MEHYLKKILTAPVYDVAKETGLEHAPKLSQLFSNEIYLKREDTQSIFSFKCRGAYNSLYHLSDTQKKQGIIASSAGNHAQGVALASKKLGIDAKIYMPQTTPNIKVEAVKALGAHTILHGDNYDATFIEAQLVAKKENRVFIPPFDDKNVICGQGTVAMEILRQSSGFLPDTIFVPVGGGGLLAGIIAFIKTVSPSIKIVGVEPEDSDCLAQSVKADKRVKLDQVGLFADGVAVKQLGELTWSIIRNNVSEVITVSTEEICAAIKDSFEATRSIVEPSGALALAGLKKKVNSSGQRDKKLVAIQSGANMSFSRLHHVVERAEIGEQKEILLAVTISEEAGSFLTFCRLLGNVIISEFNYRYSDDNEAQIFVGIQIKNQTQRDSIIHKLTTKNYQLTDLSQDELSQSHLRHMVGGRSYNLVDERIYRFTFPEKPGALISFLKIISTKWNISLFHYRNHGAAYGRVLTGLQIPQQEKQEFEAIIEKWDQNFIDETDNKAYRLFLR